MGLADRLKDLKTKATDAAAEHNEKMHEVVEKAATTADQKTGGKYHERIEKVGAKADGLVEGLKGADEQAGADAGEAAPER
jgi:uncharacterized coiled-coil DUF342 family protein